MKFLVHSWDDLTGHLLTMASQVRERSEQPDLIVAIARGGLSVAHILSDLLHLPVASFTVSSYSGLTRNDDQHMSFELGGRLDGRHVLLVDDVSDSGHTFVRAIKYLKKHGAYKITTAAIFTKPATLHPPDVFAQQTDAWIIFPFDLLENVRDIRAKWRTEGVPEKEIDRRFVEMHIPPNYLLLLSES